MDSRLKQGIELFNLADYYQSHEVLEDYWNDLDGDARNWVQGMIQCAAALHLLGQKRMAGAIKVWNRACKSFEGAPAEFEGIDLQDLRQQMSKIFSNIEDIANIDVKISFCIAD